MQKKAIFYKKLGGIPLGGIPPFVINTKVMAADYRKESLPLQRFF